MKINFLLAMTLFGVIGSCKYTKSSELAAVVNHIGRKQVERDGRIKDGLCFKKCGQRENCLLNTENPKLSSYTDQDGFIKKECYIQATILNSFIFQEEMARTSIDLLGVNPYSFR